MDSEELYCHEISRRSVARAALHLGIDNMSQDSLDVLADVLQRYLEKIGKTISALVECSGRPSSHANALDALQAIQMTTAPAAYQVNEKTDENRAGGHSNSVTYRNRRSAAWQDLALFCFGPKWEGNHEGGAGGKVGPSAAEQRGQGWRAPFVEEVPPFPLASGKVANPHRGISGATKSLHSSTSLLNETEIEDKKLNEIPDKVFTAWGSVPSFASKKEAATKKDAVDSKPSVSKESEKTEATNGEPPRKKQKIEEASKRKRPGYVPSFMPDFPESLHSARSIVEVPSLLMSAPNGGSNAAATTEKDKLGVRSSLVDLGDKGSYWGSGWDAGAPRVPVGRTKADHASAAVVVPLGRASNARVSRILEGSMDAVH